MVTLYSSTDLAVRGLRHRTGQEPVLTQDFFDGNHLRRTRHWWRLGQAEPIRFRSEIRAEFACRASAMILDAEAQYLVVRAHSNPEGGAITFEVHDALLHECIGGRDEPLTLTDAEILVESFVRHDFHALIQDGATGVMTVEAHHTNGATP